MSNISIHPHVAKTGNRLRPPTKNCTAPQKKIKTKHQERLNRRLSAWAATIKSLPSAVNPACFRKPGSMKK